MTEICSICGITFISTADLNRHFHYRHINMYNGRVDEKSFFETAAFVADDMPANQLIPETATVTQVRLSILLSGNVVW